MKYRKLEAKDYARENMKGLWAANLTPFGPDLALDEDGFRRNLRHWIDDLGLGGLFIAGKQAEFFSMSLDERKRLLEIAVDEADGNCGTLMSCSDENLDTVLELARHAEGAGADYIIVHSPPLYFHKTVDHVLYEYYHHICEQVEIGVAVWHQPDYGYVMGPDVCARIAELPNIVAIKYSVARELYSELTRKAGDKLIVSTSAEEQWLENIVELGWQVYLCSTPPYLMQTKHDRRMQEYTDLAMAGHVARAREVRVLLRHRLGEERAGHVARAREVRDSLEPVRAALRDTRPADKPQAHQKYWQDLLGQAGGPVRRPLLNLTDAEKAATKAAFEGCGLSLGKDAAA